MNYAKTRDVMDVVDERNIVRGYADRDKIHQYGFFHRVAVAFITNPQGRILLQQRSHDKKVFPGRWDLSVAEHLRVGEGFDSAIYRGLEEELGMNATGLVHLRGPHAHKSAFGDAKENAILELRKVVCDGRYEMKDGEVANAGFYTNPEIEALRKRELFTPWFDQEWTWLNNGGKKVFERA